MPLSAGAIVSPASVQAKVPVGIAETVRNQGQRKRVAAVKWEGRSCRQRGTSAEQNSGPRRRRAGNTADAILKADDKNCVVAAPQTVAPKDVILTPAVVPGGSQAVIGVASAASELSPASAWVAGIYHVQNVNAAIPA